MLAELADRLIAGDNPALSTSGMPGAGKTALAVALAHHQRVLEHFDGGVLWAGLGRQPDVPGIQASWAAALGIDISGEVEPEPRKQAICNAIGQRRVLMVIDDAWALEPAKQLRCGGRVVCLLTTRDDDIARMFAPGQARHVPELEAGPSVELLRSLAPEAWAAEPEALRQLARAVGGLPLALELLGGYLSAAEHHRFPDLLQEALAALRAPERRLQLDGGRLDAVIGLSLDQLQQTRPEALTAFYALGAFAPKPARFQRKAAEAVAECDAAVLALLIARNLLEGEGDSLALHQTLADVAVRHCPEAARQRHRDHYLALVNEDRKDWQRIETLYPQLQHAWRRQMAVAPDDDAVVRLIDAADRYQRLRGLWLDNLQWWQAALAVVKKQEDDREPARMLNNIGFVYSDLGEKQKALDFYQQALPLYRQVGDRGGEATTLSNMGAVYDALGEKQKALDFYQQALPLIRQVADRSGEFVILIMIGGLYSVLG